MLRTTLVSSTVAVLLFVASVSANVIEPRAGTLQCGTPLVASALTQLSRSTGSKRPVAFQTAKDSKGRLQLSTSVNGVAAPTTPTFEFVPCHSEPLASGTGTYQEASGAYIAYTYGILRPANQSSQCVTASSLATDGKNYPLVSAPCTTVDSYATLAPQWWSAYYNATYSKGMRYTLYFEGNTSKPGLWHLNNVASNNNRLVEVNYQAQFNDNEPFTLSMTGA
ncbi:hypothetical protein OC846_003760 [Tilletia horrida]|uniref:Secreted protein n=1 Tax=Tilletia horrida TaxID=155126 RepID=A0AAN6GU87_9BASI|nr:hypothetical protein OC845_005249 [Tilletia horrida]KAK0550210.1 hypothetical protein OC846_003760 [Tilletia horrida]KAK0565006.1 hypothetical protein OC861_003991 [Tilletia horrida]